MATQSDSTNTGVIATIVVVGAFSMIAVSALLVAMARSEQTKLDEERPRHADLETVAALKGRQLASLEAGPHWEDQAKGKVAIPIERAMKLVLEEYGRDPAAASPPAPPGMVMGQPGSAPSAAGGSGVAENPAPSGGVTPAPSAAPGAAGEGTP